MTNVQDADAPASEAASVTPVQPFSIARVLREGAAIFRRTGLMLTGMALALISLPEAVTLQLLGKVETPLVWHSFVPLGLGMTINLVAKMALMHFVMEDFSGGRPSVRRSLLQGFRLWPAALGLTLLIGIGTVLGLIFLIVPGVIVIVTCYVAAPYRIANGPGVMDAIKGSTELTKGSRWAILGLFLITWAATLVPYGVIWLVSRSPLVNAGSVGLTVYQLLASPLYNALLAVVGAVFAASAFHELTHRGRLEINRAAEVFA